MKIVVLNGSPKGRNSITLQTINYLQKKFTEDKFDIINVGQQIKSLEKDMSGCIEKINNSDMILFAYPVYTFIAPYQLSRFIELLKENLDDISDKYATQITTSKHFYDITAHRYIEDNCHDLGLKVIKGFSADMEDLLSEKGRKEALDFWKFVHFSYENKNSEVYEKSKPKNKEKYAPVFQGSPKTDEFDTVIVTNCKDDDENLRNMVADFRNVYPYNTRVINITEYKFAGGCLGCFNCAIKGKCIYKDGFDEFLRKKIQKASAIIYAFTIKDHSMGASFKLYDDRQFCNGHRTVTMGMPVGYIVSGEYSKESNLKNIIEGRCEVGNNFLTGVVSDEFDTARAIKQLSETTVYALKNKLVLPQNFLGIGGMKIFRDLIYVMRGLMKEDHRFYKKYGFYDFPQKKIGTILKMQFVGLLMGIPAVKKKAGTKMNDAMIAPYKKAIERKK
jgi:multimeric flavodoxin WrbA